MDVFYYTETDTGCFKWRAAVPAKYLSKRGHNVQIYAKDAAATVPDVIVFFRSYSIDPLPIFNWCRQKGVRVIYDTDDALDLIPPENVNYATLRDQMDKMEPIIAGADAVTTTTPVLAAHLRQWNPNVVVIPNSVDPEEWVVRPRSHEGGLRIGWTGSATHFEDLSLALDAVADLKKRRPFQFVLQGLAGEAGVQALYDDALARQGKDFRDSRLGRSIKRFIDKTRKCPHEFHPYVPVTQHAAEVCGLALDIGIAPLADGEFNRHKSCIKYYEFAMAGAVTVASRVIPYSEEVPITVKNNYQHWYNGLQSLLDSDLQSTWMQQRDWVLANRNIETIVELWEWVLRGESEKALAGNLTADQHDVAPEITSTPLGAIPV